MYVTVSQLLALGISEEEISLNCGKWQPLAVNNGEQAFLISSLPQELQLKCLVVSQPNYQYFAKLLTDAPADYETEIIRLLSRLSSQARDAWIRESLRLSKLIERYHLIRPKRHIISGKPQFTVEVNSLCQELVCQEPLILEKQPYRAAVPSPYTLDGWLRAYRREGIVCFLRAIAKEPSQPSDKRRAKISLAVQVWINNNWRRFQGARLP